MKVFESKKGQVKKIRDNHFEVKIFSELGYCTLEERHSTLEEVINKHNL